MPSEQRLHPVSMLFALGGALKALAVPALLVLLTSSRRSGGPFGADDDRWQMWAMVLLVPAAIMAVLKYLSFRLTYEENELVIRTGILFRNERHVPYARIQNLGAVRNVFHRLLGVTEVRVETGSGKEPEATISVVPVAAFDEMRQRVFGGRPAREGVQHESPAGGQAAAASAEHVLLALPTRELVLHGIIQNRGMLVIAAFFGLLWELGLAETIGDRLFGDAAYGRGVVREIFADLAGGRLPLVRLLMAAAAAAGALLVVQAASIAWAIVKLHGFRLSRAGEDLRTEYGLFTRVTSTIPLRRVQTLSVHEGPLQRWLSRAAVRVETAGGQPRGGEAAAEREWVAPIIRAPEARPLASQIMPELDLASLEWQPVHPNAFRRAVKVTLAWAFAVSAAMAPASWGLSLGALAALVPWAIVSARRHVRHLGWAATGDVVAFRSGWIWRRITVARVVKIQAVALLATPFDRRTGMGRLRVDTAGASERSHRVNVPYLPWEVARALHRDLSHRAATTVFRW